MLDKLGLDPIDPGLVIIITIVIIIVVIVIIIVIILITLFTSDLLTESSTRRLRVRSPSLE